MWQCYITSELRTVWQISNSISKELEVRNFSHVSVHKQRLPGALKEVVDGPNEWGSYVVKDLKTGKEHLCGRRYIVENEVDDKSFEEWWDELDDIEKEEYNAIMSKENEEMEKQERQKGKIL